jgi:glucokinase
MTEPVLVADIGGTHARFAMARPSGGAVAIETARVFRANEFSTLLDVAKAYFAAVSARPKAACFAAAGPVTDEVVEFTNSPWTLDIEETRRTLGFERFLVVNDFAALAAGVRSLKSGDFVRLKPGTADPEGPVLVVGPGTGFGQALIVPCAGRERIVATEGGHVAFAPQTEEEALVHRFLARTHPRVSIERLLSGPGIVGAYRAFVAASGARADNPDADDITRAALAGGDALAEKTVLMFCAALGAVAGDAALATGARGGVFLGGGILPKIRPMLERSAFVERFLDKGRMRAWLDAVPVDLIVREGVALIGAALLLSQAGMSSGS